MQFCTTQTAILMNQLRDQLVQGNHKEISKLDSKIESKLIPLLIFNPLSWKRSDLIEIDMGGINKGHFKDSNGKIFNSQICKGSRGILEDKTSHNIWLIQKAYLPAMGMDVVYFDSTPTTTVISTDLQLLEKDEIYIIENSKIKVSIAKETGLITQIYHKGFDKEFLNSPSNRLILYHEEKGADAWNFDLQYDSKQINYDLTSNSISILEQGPLRISIEITRKILESTYVQRIQFYPDQSFINTTLEIDLKDPKIMCKLYFDVNLQSDVVSSEIPYAFIDRTVEPKTILDKARFENACQKWISVSDGQYGLTLTNNGKYGCNVKPSSGKGTILQPTVIRTPNFTGYAKETMYVQRAPNGGLNPSLPKYTDLHYHPDIQYGIYFHSGDWRKDAWKKAYEHNYPLRTQYHLVNKQNDTQIMQVKSHKTQNSRPVPKELSFPFSILTIDAPNVQCTTLKVAEDESNLTSPQQYILRLVEQTGKISSCSLEFCPQITLKKVEIVDLLELHPILHTDFTDHVCKININPYEILTLRITIQ
jgi:alpha-mannosidase